MITCTSSTKTEVEVKSYETRNSAFALSLFRKYNRIRNYKATIKKKGGDDCLIYVVNVYSICASN